MIFDPEIHHRRSVRLSWHDYSGASWYFVTICAARRGDVLGRVENGAVRSHPYGRIVEACWRALPEHFAYVALDDFIVMPDHFHGILIFQNQTPTPVGAQHAAPETNALADVASGARAQNETRNGPNVAPQSLGAVTRSFKSAVTRRINEKRGAPTKVWQRGYWDHIIRDERDLENHRRYILENPIRWQTKRDYPS